MVFSRVPDKTKQWHSREEYDLYLCVLMSVSLLYLLKVTRSMLSVKVIKSSEDECGCRQQPQKVLVESDKETLKSLKGERVHASDGFALVNSATTLTWRLQQAFLHHSVRHGHSRQCLRFHQACQGVSRKLPRCGSPLYSMEDTCLVCVSSCTEQIKPAREVEHRNDTKNVLKMKQPVLTVVCVSLLKTKHRLKRDYSATKRNHPW